MKITTEESVMKMIRVFTLIDGPVVNLAHSVVRMRIDRGVIEYRWTGHGWIVPNNFDAIDLAGPNVKKDGSNGASWYNRRAERVPANWKLEEFALAPGWEWLQKIIDELRPGDDGMASITVFREYEIEA